LACQAKQASGPAGKQAGSTHKQLGIKLNLQQLERSASSSSSLFYPVVVVGKGTKGGKTPLVLQKTQLYEFFCNFF
jgi:hypothetical protein